MGRGAQIFLLRVPSGSSPLPVLGWSGVGGSVSFPWGWAPFCRRLGGLAGLKGFSLGFRRGRKGPWLVSLGELETGTGEVAGQRESSGPLRQ